MHTAKGKYLFPLMIIISIAYILYVAYVNFVHDPEAADFLSHKVKLARTINVPVWLNVMHLHIVAACLAMVSGAFNFATRIMHNYRTFHRINGYLYVLFVFIVCGTSGFMAPYSTGGRINSIAFNLVNMIWFAMTIAAIVQIKRKQVAKHRKWMVRSYAFCFTNMFIHLLTTVFYDGFGMTYTTSYTIGVYGTILLNFVLAEIVIRMLMQSPPDGAPAGIPK